MVRARFNASRLVQRAASGDVTEALKTPGRAPSAAVNEPPGTLSRIVRYKDARGRVLAVVHRYLRPDGTLGGSGWTDPKWVLDGAEALTPSHEDLDSCPACATWKPRALAFPKA
jgi:hypothetical protein